MNSDRKLRVVNQMAKVFLALLLSANVVSARFNKEERSAEPVLLRLLLPDAAVCVGAKAMPAEIELRNVSSRTVQLGVAGVGSGLHFQVYSGNADPRRGPIFRSLDNIGDAWPKAKMQKIVTLPGGDSYRTNGEILLDPKFLAEPGIYKVSIDFSGHLKLPPAGSEKNIFDGEITSNWVYFEVQDCDY
jgi:hypothetical protein